VRLHFPEVSSTPEVSTPLDVNSESSGSAGFAIIRLLCCLPRDHRISLPRSQRSLTIPPQPTSQPGRTLRYRLLVIFYPQSLGTSYDPGLLQVRDLAKTPPAFKAMVEGGLIMAALKR
jgi:hypothetical protein